MCHMCINTYMIILQQDCVVNHVIRNYGIIMDQLIHVSVSADQLHDTISVRMIDAPSDKKWYHVMDLFSSPEWKAHRLAYSISRHPLSVVHQHFQTASPLNLQGPLLINFICINYILTKRLQKCCYSYPL